MAAMALSSTNFNKNHSSSLMQINAHGKTLNEESTVFRGAPQKLLVQQQTGIQSSTEVYGDWKQSNIAGFKLSNKAVFKEKNGIKDSVTNRT